MKEQSNVQGDFLTLNSFLSEVTKAVFVFSVKCFISVMQFEEAPLHFLFEGYTISRALI